MKGEYMEIMRTDSCNQGFRALCTRLDRDLDGRYGRAQEKYDQHNIIEDNGTVIVGYLDDIPVAGGCFKILDPETIEIKRMFVVPEHRRKGYSTRLLIALEEWARELEFSIALLETGKGQPEAIQLYQTQGYEIIENYGPYAGVENSLCMKKRLDCHNVR